MFFVVERRTGPEWDPAKPLEEQSGWEGHAARRSRTLTEREVRLRPSG